MNTDIALQRLDRQRITRGARRRAAQVVSWFGAVQAQEVPAAAWGLALRMPSGATREQILRAFDRGRILRTHVMRPTWHFVTPADIRWLLALTAPRVHRVMAPSNRGFGLDQATLVRAAAVFERALAGGRALTRVELGARLSRAGIAATGQRLARIAMYAELEGVVCSGPRRGRQFTYALLDERAPGGRRLARDAALAELTRRYFRSHGPATVHDFVWWSGLTVADARRGLEMIRARPSVVDGRTYWTARGPALPPARRAPVHLLPVYDEYLVAYRDRHAVPHGPFAGGGAPRSPAGLHHSVIVAGQVGGSWKPVPGADGAAIIVMPRTRLSGRERAALETAASRYGRFLGMPASLRIAPPAPAQRR